eukprot:TRINITY_DN10369_c0_g1_i1.p1 TRINITY_DN10369_c0_g1~~TRINITY_DN10369_c0_g1_i1.p1  ORF type:complete len:651 (-),score=137.59 TRINITY_DN10369_c0_g1_i1:518-2440(-)
MDGAARATRVRRRSAFRACNSYLAKKSAVEVARRATQLSAQRSKAARCVLPYATPVVRLSVHLMDTYEAINRAFFDTERHAHASALAPAAQHAPLAHGSTRASAAALSPMSVQYCDKNHDYIVRTGELFNNRYTLEKVIGRGSFGQVVRAYDTLQHTHVAIKIIKNHSLYVEQALSEARMTSYLNRIDPLDSHSIMRLRDKFIFRGHHCLVLELLSFSLYDLLRSTDFYGVSLNLVRKFCKQILSCLCFLARADVNIAHCDLKPENVLLRHPQRSAIKVVDFGASCRISPSMYTYVQSRFYRAPEVILGLPYSTQVDVWSLGCMLVELHTGYPLFAGNDEADQMAVIVERLGVPPKHMLEQGTKSAMFFERDKQSAEWRLRPNPSSSHARNGPRSNTIEHFVQYHTESLNGRRKRASGGHSQVDYDVFLSLAKRMLEYDPQKRISAKDALEHAFVKGSLCRGRDSPHAMSELPEAVQRGGSAKVETGRKAPVQRRRKEVCMEELERHKDASLGDLSDISRDVGGALQKSKSEPFFRVAPTASIAECFVFKQSVWAEEVGIEPAPWRAGGLSGVPFGSALSGVCTRGERRREVRALLPAAGGGSAVNASRRAVGGVRFDLRVARCDGGARMRLIARGHGAV